MKSSAILPDKAAQNPFATSAKEGAKKLHASVPQTDIFAKLVGGAPQLNMSSDIISSYTVMPISDSASAKATNFTQQDTESKDIEVTRKDTTTSNESTVFAAEGQKQINKITSDGKDKVADTKVTAVEGGKVAESDSTARSKAEALNMPSVRDVPDQIVDAAKQSAKPVQILIEKKPTLSSGHSSSAKPQAALSSQTFEGVVNQANEHGPADKFAPRAQHPNVQTQQLQGTAQQKLPTQANNNPSQSELKGPQAQMQDAGSPSSQMGLRSTQVVQTTQQATLMGAGLKGGMQVPVTGKIQAPTAQNLTQALSGTAAGKGDTEGVKENFEVKTSSALERVQAAQQVAKSMKRMLAEGTTKLTLSLKPDKLGEVDIKLEMVDKVVTNAVLIADKETSEALRAQVANFERIFEEAGMKLENSMTFLNRDDQGQKNFDNQTTPTNFSGGFSVETGSEATVVADLPSSHDGSINIQV